ncbi:MAG: hypothetical protein PHP85_12840 [Gallionella sp.]|nr:hypothetical protein [Gallionella sp.]
MSRFLSVVFVASLIFSVQAVAARDSASVPEGAADHVMSRDELRRCMTREKRIDEMDAELLTLKTPMNAQKAEMKRLKAKLDHDKPLIDMTSQPSIDAYNALADQWQAVADAYNAQVEPLNVKTVARNAANEIYQKQCVTNMSWRESDKAAILSGK